MRHTSLDGARTGASSAASARRVPVGVRYRAGVPTPEETPIQRPWTLRLLVAIVLLEAAVLVGFAVFFAVGLLSGQAETSPGGAAFTLVLLAAFGAWLVAAAAYLWRGKRWPRSAALVAQLFALTIGVPTLTGGVVAIGLLILVPAVTVIVLLFERRVLAFTQAPRRPEKP